MIGKYLIARRLIKPADLPIFNVTDFKSTPGGISDRISCRDHPATLALHKRWKPLVECFAQSFVVPTYTFATIYNPFADLPSHIDRPECQWNLGVAHSYSAGVPWEFLLDIDDRFDPDIIRLEPGDGVIYPGYHRHWRHRQQVAQHVTMMLFHYVSVRQ
jgi:alkylated DNA repair dioxygenase AlkB